MHDDVGAKFNRVAEHRRGYGVVHNHRHTMTMRRRTDGLQIDDIPRRITDGFAIHRLGFIIDQFLDGLGRIILGKAHLDSLTGKHMCEQGVGPTI